jgi:hypothetical protein
MGQYGTGRSPGDSMHPTDQPSREQQPHLNPTGRCQKFCNNHVCLLEFVFLLLLPLTRAVQPLKLLLRSPSIQSFSHKQLAKLQSSARQSGWSFHSTEVA